MEKTNFIGGFYLVFFEEHLPFHHTNFLELSFFEKMSFLSFLAFLEKLSFLALFGFQVIKIEMGNMFF
jgi:hypothetical protein